MVHTRAKIGKYEVLNSILDAKKFLVDLILKYQVSAWIANGDPKIF